MDNLKVIIDVGARDTTYPEDYPEAVCHLFEPHPKHFKILEERFKGIKNVILNNYGLGEKAEMLPFDPYVESFVVGTMRDCVLEVRTLDEYIKANCISKIDLLKTDCEAMDYKVLLGGSNAVTLSRYIKYEYWEEQECFNSLLATHFNMTDIGERNVLCTRK